MQSVMPGRLLVLDQKIIDLQLLQAYCHASF